MRRRILIIASALTIVGVVVALLRFRVGEGSPRTPALILAALTVGWAAIVRVPWFRKASLLTASLLIALALLETALALKTKPSGVIINHVGRDTRTPYGDILGFGPKPGHRYRHVRTVDGETCYDVRCTIDERGLRSTAGVDGIEPGITLLCFGGSFMFGEGVEDDDTLPARVAIRSAGRVRAHNFGHPGYGAHQMTRALDSGLVERLVQPVGRLVAVYLAIPDHVWRTAGQRRWDLLGPRYRLGPDGEARPDGRFLDDFWSTKFRECYFGRWWLSQVDHPTDEMIRLHAAVVERARDELRRIDGDAVFRVLLWDHPSDRRVVERMKRELRARDLQILSVAQALGLAPHEGLGSYTIPNDGHPSSACHDRLAEFLLRELLSPTTAD